MATTKGREGISWVPAALEELLGGLIEVAIRATEASEGSIVLLDHERELLTMGLAGGPKKSLVRMARRHVERSISAWVADHKEPLLIIGPVRDPRFFGVEREIKDAICVPLLLDDKVMGVLSVSNSRGREQFNQRDLETLLALAGPGAKVIASGLAHVSAEEESYLWERRHLAQEIHDGVIQELTALFLQLEVYEKLQDRDASRAQEQLGKIKQQVKSSLQELRRLVFNLRISDVEEASLTQMLEHSVADFQRSSGIKATFKVKGEERELSSQAKSNLLSIVQEALTNIGRHSGAKNASVSSEYGPGEIRLTITDDGRGFDWEGAIQWAWKEKKFGLMGMQERAHLLGGTLEIDSAPKKGTAIKVTLPLAQAAGVANLR